MYDKGTMNNNNITIVCIDTRDSDRAAAARTLSHCQTIFPCYEALLLTDKKLGNKPSNISIVSNIRSVNDNRSYDFFVLSQLVNYVTTSHYLIIQTDGFILNPNAWDNKFLDYDYIGAPWAHSPLHDWIPHRPVGSNNSVGNGGFSLRSKKLGGIARDIFCSLSRQELFLTDHWYPEDCFICRDMRVLMDLDSILKFAPEDVALKFSCENRKYTDQFGYHGRETMRMNKIEYK